MLIHLESHPHILFRSPACFSHTESSGRLQSQSRGDRHRLVFDAYEHQSPLFDANAKHLYFSNLSCYLTLPTTKAEKFEVTHITHIKIFGTRNFSFLFPLYIASFTLQTTLDSKLLLAHSLVSLPNFNCSKFLQPGQ